MLDFVVSYLGDLFLFPASAHAQEIGEAAGEPSAFAQFIPLILIFVIFYFLLIRPQQKKMKEHRQMVDAVRRGDKVITGGGIVGTVSKVNDDRVSVEIAKGTEVEVVKSTITEVVAKTGKVEDASDSNPAAGKAKAPAKKGPAKKAPARKPAAKKKSPAKKAPAKKK